MASVSLKVAEEGGRGVRFSGALAVAEEGGAVLKGRNSL